MEQTKSQLKNQLDEWVRSLHTLQQLVEDRSGNIATLLQQTHDQQSQFQDIIRAVGAAGLSPATEQKLQSYQTEAHRRLRLLSVASMKLKTARSPETVAQVRSQLTEHIDQLRQFAIAMASEVTNEI